MLSIKIGLIGAGRMATALARGFVDAKLLARRRQSLLAIRTKRPAQPSSAKCRARKSSARTRRSSHVPTWCSWPSSRSRCRACSPRFAARCAADALVVSIAAGVTLKALAAGLPPRSAHRSRDAQHALPDRPGRERFSVWADTPRRPMGGSSPSCSRPWVSRSKCPKSQLDAVTGLSGSGPAFVYSMIEALTAGGVAMGLPAELAAELAARTVAGAAEMVLQTGETPAVLRDRVTSPGGTTLAGLDGFGTSNGSAKR